LETWPLNHCLAPHLPLSQRFLNVCASIHLMDIRYLIRVTSVEKNMASTSECDPTLGTFNFKPRMHLLQGKEFDHWTSWLV